MFYALYIVLISSTPNLAAGKTIFTKSCVVCHGSSGKGDGVASAALNPKPADFTDEKRQKIMTKEKQLNVVTKGGAIEKLSPLMPAFEDLLTPQQILDVVSYLRDSFYAKENK